MSFKSGFVSIIGRPNAGKSTLLNHILDTKVAITSSTAQTTRNTIQGIYTDDDAQIVFMDTPGIHKPQDSLGSFMTTNAMNSIYGVDLVLLIAPADEKIGHGDQYIINRLKDVDVDVYLVLNKVDLLEKDEIIEKLASWQELYNFKQIIPISAKNGDNVDQLLNLIKDDLNEGIMYYPKDMVVNHPEQFIVAELIRERILYFTTQEVPHNVAIVIEKYEETDNGMHIMADIIVDHPSQKGIIIGKQGKMIQKIRTQSKKEMKKFLNTNVDLELFVKVEKGWRNKTKYLKEFGYDENNY